ncbi:MAG TPA: hypothetical protein PLT00_13175 [Verrucomicrobiota bacterium]|nr:hypothetical protein [Verrucomicrobiota bacterium]HQB17653.1 hypothetical protein [Verrucomicrobiota bacterium]
MCASSSHDGTVERPTTILSTPAGRGSLLRPRAELYRTCGVGLTQAPGFQSGTALAHT